MIIASATADDRIRLIAIKMKGAFGNEGALPLLCSMESRIDARIGPPQDWANAHSVADRSLPVSFLQPGIERTAPHSRFARRLRSEVLAAADFPRLQLWIPADGGERHSSVGWGELRFPGRSLSSIPWQRLNSRQRHRRRCGAGLKIGASISSSPMSA